jgi:uncharacterized protein (DUF427 family)
LATPLILRLKPGENESLIHTVGVASHHSIRQVLKKEIMKATWNGAVIAESNETVVVEGNHYFPPDAIDKQYFKSSDTHTICPWKGEASYYNVVVNGETNKDAAWYYPETKPEANNIKGYVAFWRGVKVEQ